MTGALAAAAAASAVALALPGRVVVASAVPATASGGAVLGSAAELGWMRRWRGPLSLLAGIGALTLLGGQLGLLAAPLAAAASWMTISRLEPASVRRARAEARRQLPHVVRLLGAALAAGAAPAEALDVVADALPGLASDRLRPVAVRLRLGADPTATWAILSGDAALAPLGRALARAQASGVSVAVTVARLADDLARTARADVEERARAVGVRAAAPLGLCLLPSFLLIGIVPLVGALLTALRW